MGIYLKYAKKCYNQRTGTHKPYKTSNVDDDPKLTDEAVNIERLLSHVIEADGKSM